MPRTFLILLAVPLVSIAAISPAHGQSPADRYDHHFEAGNRAQTAWRHQEALGHYQAAVEAYRQIPAGEKPNRVDRLYYNLALANVASGNIAEGLAIWKEVEAWRTKNLGQADPENIEVVHLMALWYSTAMDYENAYAYSLLHLKLSERRFGAQSTETARACEEHALVLMKWLSHRPEIDELLARSLAILEARVGPRAYDLHSSLQLMAQRALSRGEYRKAESLLARCKTLEPHKAINEINRLTHLRGDRFMEALLYSNTGRFWEAEAAYRDCLAIVVEKQKLQPKARNSDIADMQSSLGELYAEMGLPEKSLEYYRLSVAGYEKAGRSDSHFMAFAMHGIAKAHYRRGELEKALEVYQEAHTGKRSHAALPAEYAAVLRDLGRYKEATEYLEKKLAEIRKSEGAKSPIFLQVLEQQAALEAAKGQGEEAHKLYQQVIEKIGVSPGHAGIAAARMGQARIAHEAGDKKSALTLADLARRELRRFARRVLPSLGEYEQLEFLANREASSLEESLSIALSAGEDQQAIDVSADWVINAKGLAQEAVAQRTLEARETKDPRQAADLRDWLAIRYRLAKISLAGTATSESESDAASKEGNEKRDREIAALTAREQLLAKQLGRPSIQDKSDPWVDLSAVRSKLSADSVLIEIVRYTSPRKKKAPATTARYLAWIIPRAGQGEVNRVDLGPCDAIDAAVAAARKPLLAAREAILDVGEAEAEKALQKELAGLSQKLLTPLRPHLKDYPNWIISPDGSLWLVPWSALLVEGKAGEAKYLVESHTTRLVVSGRDLVELAGRKASGNPSLVLADPDFDLAPTTTKTIEASSQVPLATVDDPRTQATRSAAVRSAVSTSWPRLPGTAQEAKALEPKLAAYTGAGIDVRVGPAAAEAVVRDAWQPRVAVLSTHGYFLDRGEGASNAVLQSPLVRCGLVLAGANQRAKGADSPDDGILTGLEIVGADLRGTELVVLSACETALGEIRAAEGVAGLRQAFQLAGAQSVLASLWRVPDADTAQLMTEFYESLAKTADKATALALAQRALLASHREGKSGSGHPYYWAAFTLTGRTDRPAVLPPAARPAPLVIRRRVEVLADSAPIMDGATQVALGRRGDSFEVAGEQGDWVLVTVPGRPKPGWIQRRHLRTVTDEK